MPSTILLKGVSMKHNVEVLVSNKLVEESVVSLKRVPIGLRLYNKLFGNKEKMTVIILGKTVENITIKEKDNCDG